MSSRSLTPSRAFSSNQRCGPGPVYPQALGTTFGFQKIPLALVSDWVEMGDVCYFAGCSLDVLPRLQVSGSGYLECSASGCIFASQAEKRAPELLTVRANVQTSAWRSCLWTRPSRPFDLGDVCYFAGCSLDVLPRLQVSGSGYLECSASGCIFASQAEKRAPELLNSSFHFLFHYPYIILIFLQ